MSAPRFSPGRLDLARDSLALIEGTLKAYTSKQWWRDHGVYLVDNVRRGLETREIQEGLGEDFTESEPAALVDL